MKTEIWTAIHTPFHADGSIDEDGLRANVEAYVARGIAGVFCNGLMGENWSVPVEDRLEIVRILSDQSAGRLKVCSVASIGSDEDTIKLGLRYKEAGLDYVCLTTPAEPQPDEELVRRFNYKMDSIDMPTVIFNAVRVDGTSVLTPSAFRALNENPHLRILKSTVSDEMNLALRAEARDDVLVSDPAEEKFFVNATQYGQRILFADPEPVLYQTETFRPIQAYTRLIEEGRIIFDALAPLRVEYNKWLMIEFYRGTRINQYLKKWVSLIGLVGGYVREPLVELTPVENLAMEMDIAAAMEKVHAALGEELV